MSFGNNTGRFVFVNIKEGRLAIKRGNEIVFHNWMEGLITGIDIRMDSYNTQQYQKLCVNINDGTEDCQLQMKLDSGYGRAFCCMIENVDLKKPVRITPTYEEKDAKKLTGMFMNQGGQPIKWKYTKDHPNGRPDLDKVNFRGQDMWDNTKQQLFYYEMLMTKIKPQLGDSIIDGPAHQLDQKPYPLANEITEPIDDLPF